MSDLIGECSGAGLLGREARKQRFTFTQLEEIEADWDKPQRWFERIQALLRPTLDQAAP